MNLEFLVLFAMSLLGVAVVYYATEKLVGWLFGVNDKEMK